jgi:hypothetical protein
MGCNIQHASSYIGDSRWGFEALNRSPSGLWILLKPWIRFGVLSFCKTVLLHWKFCDQAHIGCVLQRRLNKSSARGNPISRDRTKSCTWSKIGFSVWETHGLQLQQEACDSNGPQCCLPSISEELPLVASNWLSLQPSSRKLSSNSRSVLTIGWWNYLHKRRIRPRCCLELKGTPFASGTVLLSLPHQLQVQPRLLILRVWETPFVCVVILQLMWYLVGCKSLPAKVWLWLSARPHQFFVDQAILGSDAFCNIPKATKISRS